MGCRVYLASLKIYLTSGAAQHPLSAYVIGFACKAKRPFVHNLFTFSLAFVLTFEDRQCPVFLL